MLKEAGAFPANPTLEEKRRIVEETYVPLVNVIQETIARVTDRPPEQWLRSAYRCLHHLQRDLGTDFYPPPVREYLGQHLEEMITLLKAKELRQPLSPDPESNLKLLNERVWQFIHQTSDLLLLQRAERELPDALTLSMEEILARPLDNGYVFSRSAPESDGICHFEIHSPQRDEPFSFPLPPTDKMLHKGGFPRVVLKILNGAPPEIIERELPPNDLDVIAWGEEDQANKFASDMNVDISGVEISKSEEPSFEEWLGTRDADLNAGFIGRDYLKYTAAAAEAARTGHITPLPSSRGLYGSNMMYYQGELLLKSRDLMRMLKFVAEGKALSFSFKELNKQVPIDIRLLVLVDKFLRKPNRDELMDKLFYLLNQTGQVKNGENNLWEVLERIHTQLPFYVVGKQDPTDTEVSVWLMEKLGQQALRRLSTEYHIPSTLELERFEGDTAEQIVSLDGYLPQPPSEDGLQRFLANARIRNQSYFQKNQSPYLELSPRIDHLAIAQPAQPSYTKSMSWQKTNLILKRRLNQHGLTDLVEAGVLCRQAELLYPNLFRAISVRNATLHLEVTKSQTLSFKLIEGKLLKELNTCAHQQHLPPITHIRLTFPLK